MAAEDSVASKLTYHIILIKNDNFNIPPADNTHRLVFI